MLLDWKTTGISKPALVGTLVRSLSKRTEERHEGTFNAPLFKGMVLATRIAAMVFKAPSATPEILVSEEQGSRLFIILMLSSCCLFV